MYVRCLFSIFKRWTYVLYFKKCLVDWENLHNFYFVIGWFSPLSNAYLMREKSAKILYSCHERLFVWFLGITGGFLNKRFQGQSAASGPMKRVIGRIFRISKKYVPWLNLFKQALHAFPYTFTCVLSVSLYTILNLSTYCIYLRAYVIHTGYSRSGGPGGKHSLHHHLFPLNTSE